MGKRVLTDIPLIINKTIKMTENQIKTREIIIIISVSITIAFQS
jgi:hypothetical protein